MFDIRFREDSSSGYASRTKENASADATIALAINFNSAGERLTKKLVKEQGNLYIAIDAHNLEDIELRADKIVRLFNQYKVCNLNIAGNGIYTMNGTYAQQEVDNFTFELLKAVITHPDLENTIKYIRTGGQTGFDEAGAKAGSMLDIPTFVLAPKGWKFRDRSGRDISNETLFKQRFT